MRLCWQPLFGGGLRIGWSETLDLTMDEALNMLDTMTQWRRDEVNAAFGK